MASITAESLRSFIDRVDAAKADYGVALSQILDDAKDAGVRAELLLPDMALLPWAKAQKAPGSVYFAKVQDLDVIKIGFSTSVADRMRALTSEHGRRFEVLGTVTGTMEDERWFHRMLWWCRDRTLKGNEFFSYPAIRGLVRIFLANADRFPMNAENKGETAAWVNKAREVIAPKHTDHASALAAIGRYFEHAAAQNLAGESK